MKRTANSSASKTPHRAKKRTAALSLRVFVQNRAGRKGVPLSASFEHWVRVALLGRHSGGTQVNIIVFDEAAGRDMNRQYRGKDYATNILSFAYEPSPHEKPGLLGDLVICAPVVAREAIQQHKSLRDHYAHLTIHGVLHLLGHDHEKPAEAEHMEAIEREVLERLGIADPYA